MRYVVNHIIAPALKYWVIDNGLSMTSIEEFSKQLFTEDSVVQILNVSYISMGPLPTKTIVFDLGYYKNNKLFSVTSLQMVLACEPLDK